MFLKHNEPYFHVDYADNVISSTVMGCVIVWHSPSKNRISCSPENIGQNSFDRPVRTKDKFVNLPHFSLCCKTCKGTIHKSWNQYFTFLNPFTPFPPSPSPSAHTWAWNFFHGGGSVLHKPKFRKGGGSIFQAEFSDIIAFLLPNFFGKPRKGVIHPGRSTFRKGGKAVYSWR